MVKTDYLKFLWLMGLGKYAPEVRECYELSKVWCTNSHFLIMRLEMIFESEEQTFLLSLQSMDILSCTS